MLKHAIKDSGAAGNTIFADVVEKGANDFVRPNNLSSIAIYPTDKLKSRYETKTLTHKITRPD